jgi:hypothetical protein
MVLASIEANWFPGVSVISPRRPAILDLVALASATRQSE